MIWDCRVPGGCSLKRPDLLYQFERFFLQLEVDEGGHQDKRCFDEDARLAVIAADVDLPGIVLRINPDLDDFTCFRQIQLSNGEKALKSTEHFPTLMHRVINEAQQYLASPPSEGVLQVFIDAGPEPGVRTVRSFQADDDDNDEEEA